MKKSAYDEARDLFGRVGAGLQTLGNRAGSFVQQNPMPSVGIPRYIQQTYAQPIQNTFNRAGTQFNNVVQNSFRGPVSPIPNTPMQNAGNVARNLIGTTGKAIIQDMPGIVGAGLRLSPPGQLAQYYQGGLNRTFAPLNPIQQLNDVGKVVRGAGYAMTPVVGQAIGGAVNVGIQGVMNKVNQQPFFQDYANSFAQGIRMNAQLGPVSKLNPLFKGITAGKFIASPTQYNLIQRAGASAARNAIEGGMLGLLDEKGNKLDNAMQFALFGGVLGAVTQSGGDLKSLSADKLSKAFKTSQGNIQSLLKYLNLPVGTNKFDANGKKIYIPMWKSILEQGKKGSTTIDTLLPGKIGKTVEKLSKPSSIGGVGGFKTKPQITKQSIMPQGGSLPPQVPGGEGSSSKPIVPQGGVEIGKGVRVNSTPIKSKGTVSPEVNTQKTIVPEQISFKPIISQPTAKQIAEAESQMLTDATAEMAQSGRKFGDYETLANKMKNFLRLQGETRSPKGELYREHIPGKIFGQSSDEIATALGKTESEFMAELTQDLKMMGGNASPAVISSFRQKVVKLKTIYDKLDPKFYKIIKDWENNVTAVTAQATDKTIAKINKIEIINQERARVKAEQTQYKEFQKRVFGEANTRSTSKAINNLVKSMKTATNQGVLDGADAWKDKPRLSYVRETMERNFEDIMGKDAPIMKEKLLNPVFKAEAERNKFLNTERASIKSLGINPRSKESALVQALGEGKITLADIKDNPKADKIINAEKVLSKKYDDYLNKLNTVLTRNGYDPIPKRKDYFHHFDDLNGMFEQIGVAIKAQDLPTDINGLTADFKPGKTFFNAALQRKGTKTAIDAITGIDRYLEGASNQIYHTDNIQGLRAFETALREKYAGTNHLTNFTADLGEYINKLAGKKAMLDRAVESVVGRRIYTGANALKSQTGANMTGANISSAMTNWIPVSQTLATTNKKSVAQAMLGIIKNVFKDDGFIEQSNFLTSRLNASDRLSATAWQKTQKAGYWPFKIVDSFTSQLAVRSKYLEGIGKGLSETEAILKADSWGRKTLGGRSAGEMPTLFNSKTLGFFTQFQLEVNNQLSFMGKDIPRNFNKAGAASAIGQLFVYWYAYNTIYEKMFGRRPAFDPIGVAQQAYEDYTNPNMKSGQANKNLVKNVSNQLPFTSALTGGRIPIGGALPNPFAVINGESNIKKELVKPLQYLAPPTGGGQIKKTIEGVGAYLQGASTSDSGRVRFPIPQTPVNVVRSAVAGQYASPEARQYFREGRQVLGEKQSESFKAVSDKKTFYESTMKNRASEGKKEEAIKLLLQNDKEGAKKLVQEHKLQIKEKEVIEYQKSQVKKAADLFVLDQRDQAKKIIQDAKVQLSEVEVKKAAKRKVIELFKLNLRDEAGVIARKYGVTITPKDVE